MIARASEPRDRQLNGEFSAVRFDTGKLEALARQRTISGRQVAAERVHPRRAFLEWQEERDVLAQDVQSCVAEHLLCGRIELTDAQLLIDRQNGVVRCLENGALPRFDLDAGAVHFVGQVEGRGRHHGREPPPRRGGDGHDDRCRRRAQQVARRAGLELALPDPPRVLIRREGDGDRDRRRVDEEIGHRHAEERNGHGPQAGVG
jgi:hypothetical protein